MPNIQTIIQNDTKEKLNKPNQPASNETDKKDCNCRNKDTCPLQGQCLATSVVYQATVKSENKTETYVGLTANNFKSRYNNHVNTFRDKRKRLSTELSKYDCMEIER